MRKHIGPKIGAAFVVAAAVCGGWWATTLHASDHDESPKVKTDAAVDITDLYVFDSGAGTTTIITCWAGFNDSREQPDAEGVYDDGVLYTLNIDNNGDNKPDHQIYWRYGQDADGKSGVRWENVPGADGNASGAVEAIFQAGDGARVWSGHADDPFFFDAGGYLMTLDTGDLSFNSENDFLAGFNVTAAAIEIETSLIQDGVKPMQFWVTASRK